jgi:putative oxidoreductase
VFAGAVKFVDISGTAAHITEEGLPVGSVAVVSGAFEVIAGLMILAGFGTRYAAVALALYCVVVAVIFHDFWTFTEREEIVAQMLNMFKNVTIAGGFLVLAAFGPGPISVDARRW